MNNTCIILKHPQAITQCLQKHAVRELNTLNVKKHDFECSTTQNIKLLLATIFMFICLIQNENTII